MFKITHKINDFTQIISGKPLNFLQKQLGIRHNFLTSLTLPLKSPNYKARKYLFLFPLALLLLSIVPPGAYASDWDITGLDTARNVSYLTDIEKDVILEINKVRTDPKKYAEDVLNPLLNTFIDNPWNDPLIRRKGDTWLRTKEGKVVINELIAALQDTEPMQILTPSMGMSHAAKDHTKDRASHNTTGHVGSDGSQFWDRVNRYGKINLFQAGGGECLSYGSNTGIDIVLQLLIDDGVQSRGHRKILLNPNASKIGVGFGEHPQYKYMCTLDLAFDYSEE
ncbi:hypothetical protein FACS1894109_18040 [Spirochaetia bacterium]|nr:hypothetical protein FACS1894109_18040 [Spirochaetia bacterium]